MTTPDQQGLKDLLDAQVENLDHYGRQVGTLLRQFSLAAIAVVWLFRVTTPAGATLPARLEHALFWIVSALGLDFLHSLAGLFTWVFADPQKIDEHAKNVRRHWLVATAFHIGPRAVAGRLPLRLRVEGIFFLAKLTCFVIGYALLLSFMAGYLHPA